MDSPAKGGTTATIRETCRFFFFGVSHLPNLSDFVCVQGRNKPEVGDNPIGKSFKKMSGGSARQSDKTDQSWISKGSPAASTRSTVGPINMPQVDCANQAQFRTFAEC